MRWKPVTPLAVNHAAMKDDVYDGYFIPKGKQLLVFGLLLNKYNDSVFFWNVQVQS